MGFKLRSGNTPVFKKIGSATPFFHKGHPKKSPFFKDEKEKEDNSDDTSSEDTSSDDTSSDDTSNDTSTDTSTDKSDDTSGGQTYDTNMSDFAIGSDERKAEYDKRGWAYDDTIDQGDGAAPVDPADGVGEEVGEEVPTEELPEGVASPDDSAEEGPREPTLEEDAHADQLVADREQGEASQYYKDTGEDVMGMAASTVGLEVGKDALDKNIKKTVAKQTINKATKNQLKKEVAKQLIKQGLKFGAKRALQASLGPIGWAWGAYDMYNLHKNFKQNKDLLRSVSQRNAKNNANTLDELAGGSGMDMGPKV